MPKAAEPESLRHASEDEIMAFARNVRGSRPGDFELPPRRLARYTKSDFGCRIELIFGLDCGGSPEPDFPTAHIELKSTKLVHRKSTWEVGERTSIQMIDYVDVAREDWESATVRNKLSKILFCFYQWQRGTDPDSWPVDVLQLWRPDDQQWRYLRDDWLTIHRKIAVGQADLLSESDTKVLGAATKARDSRVRRPQAAGGPPAKPRAFALKRPFVESIYESLKRRPSNVESLMQNLDVRSPAAFEAALLQRFTPFVGARISDLARELGIPTSVAKNYAARVTHAVVKRLMGVHDPRARIREFDEFGIETKIVPVKASGTVKESMSFPAFEYEDLVDQNWEESDFHLRTHRLFIAPIHQPRRDAPIGEWTLGRPFFWSPTEEEERVMRSEWSMYRDLIATGRANQLPTASETRIVHVRPKARDASDTNYAPNVGQLVTKCFWLNRDFIEGLVRAHSF